MSMSVPVKIQEKRNKKEDSGPGGGKALISGSITGKSRDRTGPISFSKLHPRVYHRSVEYAFLTNS